MTTPLGVRQEDLTSWICPWCTARNYRKAAGEDSCEECDAEVITEFTGYENELVVKCSQRPEKIS
jgi:hypothetical protein